jgi:hypothetical protein
MRMPCTKVPCLPIFLQGVVDLRTAAVHHDRIHADQLQQDDVAREAVLQAFVGHRIAAVFDDDGLAVEITDVGECFGQDLRLDLRRDRSQVVVLVGARQIGQRSVHWGPEKNLRDFTGNRPTAVGIIEVLVVFSGTRR